MFLRNQGHIWIICIYQESAKLKKIKLLFWAYTSWCASESYPPHTYLSTLLSFVSNSVHACVQML